MAVARAKGRHETDDYSIAELFSIGMPWPAAPSCPNVSSPWSACPRRPRSTTRDLTGSRVGADPEWAEQRAARAGRAAVQAYLPSAESDPDTLTPAGQSALESRWSWLARVAGQAMKEGDEGMVEDLLAGVQVWGFRPGGHHWRVSSSCTGIRIGWCLAPTASGSQRTVRQPNRVLLLAPATSLCSTQPGGSGVAAQPTVTGTVGRSRTWSSLGRRGAPLWSRVPASRHWCGQETVSSLDRLSQNRVRWPTITTHRRSLPRRTRCGPYALTNPAREPVVRAGNGEWALLDGVTGDGW